MSRKGFAPIVVLLFAVGILAVGTGLYFYSRSAAGNQSSIVVSNAATSVTTSSTPASSTFDYEILYTANGFASDTLEVPLGARVAFKNMTDAPLRVAADPSPTHTEYPEFYAGSDYASGTTYIFQFEKTGTFGYHNEDRPADRASIRVVDANNPVVDIDTIPPGQIAIRDTLIAMLDPHDPNSIFKVVDAIQGDPVLAGNCHEIAHDIGHRAYELYGFSEAMAFDNPNHLKHALVQFICAGGYMHGIVEELALYEPTFRDQPGLVCDGMSGDERASCFHGVGHAVMYIHDREASSSLENCRLMEKITDTYRCFEGVWMELFWGSPHPGESSSLGWDPEKPLDPCIVAKADEKPTCFLYSTFGYLRFHAKDYSGAVTMCTTSNLNDTDAGFCLQGLGITMMSKFNGQHLENSEVYVVGLSSKYKTAFYKGVMGYARLSGFSEAQLNGACDLLKNDTAICRTVVANYGK